MFTDFLVVELASVLAGPRVGQFFAEMGAQVIKVENAKTGGDVTRTWKSTGEQTDDRSAYFCSVNWGKRSVALDLTSADGKDILLRLVKKADLVIVSYKPGDAEKLGVDYASLSAVNPKLIYGSITGYGRDNDRVGYDAVIQAESGFMSMNGEPGGNSLKVPVAIVDVLASHHLIQGILLAIIRRGQTAKGSLVEVSLLDAAVSSLVNQATNWLIARKVPSKQGSLHPNIAPYGELFTTADGRQLLLAIGSDRQFKDLCEVLGLKEVASDERFATNSARVRHRDSLAPCLEQRIATFHSKDVLHQLHQRKIPAGMVLTVDQVFESESAAEMVIESHGLMGVTSVVMKSDGFDRNRDLLPPPHLGQHNADILSLISLP